MLRHIAAILLLAAPALAANYYDIAADPPADGLLVVALSDTDNADLRTGDIITGINNQHVPALKTYYGTFPFAGDQAELLILRDGRSRSVLVNAATIGCAVAEIKKGTPLTLCPPPTGDRLDLSGVEKPLDLLLASKDSFAGGKIRLSAKQVDGGLVTEHHSVTRLGNVPLRHQTRTVYEPHRLSLSNATWRFAFEDIWCEAFAMRTLSGKMKFHVRDSGSRIETVSERDAEGIPWNDAILLAACMPLKEDACVRFKPLGVDAKPMGLGAWRVRATEEIEIDNKKHQAIPIEIWDTSFVTGVVYLDPATRAILQYTSYGTTWRPITPEESAKIFPLFDDEVPHTWWTQKHTPLVTPKIVRLFDEP